MNGLIQMLVYVAVVTLLEENIRVNVLQNTSEKSRVIW
jgi:hypothetical protein